MRLAPLVRRLSNFVRSVKLGPRQQQAFGMVAGGTAVLGAYAISSDSLKVHASWFFSSDPPVFMADPITPTETLNKSSDFKAKMELFILKIQADFCHALEDEEEEGTKFTVDRWRRPNPEEGGGITCVLQDGKVFEKAGVNITVMTVPLTKRLQEGMRARGKDLTDTQDYSFFAAGISSVIHPRNPFVPTVHFNYRYVEVQDANGSAVEWWYGGGTDLTPYYLDEADVKHFHGALRKSCGASAVYAKYKRWCDQYFYNSMRGEARGVGGIFFDDVTGNQNKVFSFIKSCANSVIPSYIPLVQKNKDKKYSEVQRTWQLLRRGRYVEFNLVYDRGTKFGLATPGARIESILMSLPLMARWEYMHTPDEGSDESKMLEVLKNPKEWI